MATQIFEANHATLISPAAASHPSSYEEMDAAYADEPFGAFRGFFFAMIFNLILVLAGAAGWEIWHRLR